VAAVGLGDVFYDGKSQARPAESPAASLVDAVKAFEEPRQMFFFDTDPVVPHAKLDFIAGNP
jgi:hypothetical protein